MLALTDRFDAFWDETQELRVLISQDMEALRADMRTVLANQAIILRNHQSLQDQLARLLALHQPPATATTAAAAVTRPLTRDISFTLSCSFITNGDTRLICLWGGGGGGGGVVVGFCSVGIVCDGLFYFRVLALV